LIIHITLIRFNLTILLQNIRDYDPYKKGALHTSVKYGYWWAGMRDEVGAFAPTENGFGMTAPGLACGYLHRAIIGKPVIGNV
jgi:hypothetical protein